MHTTEPRKLRADHRAPVIVTSAEHHQMAATHYDNAADAYRLAADYYNYGDYQRAHEEAQVGKGEARKAEGYCALAMKWPVEEPR
jgi:hypothetical protein